MKQVLLKGGRAVLEEVPAPQVAEGSILVAVQYSCLSIGTELAGMAAAAEPLYKRAIRQPEKVRRAFAMMREQGIDRTLKRIRGQLSAGQPTGYSAAGVVVAIGRGVEKFSVGDRVACAGAGIANHAEIICVPVNLAVRVPPAVDLCDASTVTLGAIALQGVRRASPTLGETVAVIGLGILGQLTVQLLKANGCRVIGVDVDAARIATASSCGLDIGINATEEDVVGRIAWATAGLGADAVIVAAAAAGNEIVSQGMRGCRKKGRLVLVGDVGLHLKREDFYRKELDFLVSTSYGPGRYDPAYEEGGRDYPLPYVRWTENRNMEAFLYLVSAGKVDLGPLRAEIATLDKAEALYARLTGESGRPLLAILRYPLRPEAAEEQSIRVTHRQVRHSGRIRVAVVGAGSFAQAVHLPNLVRLRKQYAIRWVVGRTGATAKGIAAQYEALHAGTDSAAVLDDPEVDLVVIATRHHLHAEMALAALRAGKHVLVEKPLALNEEELAAIESFYASPGPKPVLMTGFNRRYSPPIRHIKGILRHRPGPMMISYRMNAGHLPPDHWVHGPEGGGRNVGEACHIYDLFGALTESEPVAFEALALDNLPGGSRKNENFVASIRYADGSVASLNYTSLGGASHPKERMDVYAGARVLSLDDYRSVSVAGEPHQAWSSASQQKGQLEELAALADVIQREEASEWRLSDQFAATRASLSIEQLLNRPARGDH